MNSFVAAISIINIDILYSGLPRIPNLGEEVYADEFDLQLGGGAAASLITLARFGVDSRLGTFIADDFLSTYARNILETNHINLMNLYKGEKIPVAVTSIASFPQDRYFISYFPDKNKLKASDEEVYALCSGARVCIGVDGHSDVFARLRKEGTIVAYDVGWSDDLNIENMKDILKNVDVFTPNEKEALKMTGKSTPEEALEVLSRYVDYAIIKIGKKGCITKRGGKTVHVPGLEIFEPVDTTGAGDAFLGGVMFGLYEGWDIEKCMKMGNITGGFSTTRLGCFKAYLTLEKAMDYMEMY